MLDNEFLEQAVQAATFLSLASPKQIITVKNADSVHVFCSDYLAKLTGIELDQLLGKKVWLPLYDNDSNLEKTILAEDKEIMSHREGKMLLRINRFVSGLTPYLSLKIPLINPTTNHVVGLLFQGWEIGANLTTLMVAPLNLTRKSIHLTKMPKLTKREKEVIFFFMSHLSSQEIADMLSNLEKKSMSKSTIDSIFNDQLYIKFKVHSRISLYKKLQSLGYDLLVPKELLSSTSIKLDIIQTY